MEREKYESLLNELLDGDLEHSRRTEILQELRNDHNSGREGIKELSQNNERLQRDNNDLIVSNSKLFRQAGVVGQEEEEKVEQKEFSETVTIEQLEGANM